MIYSELAARKRAAKRVDKELLKQGEQERKAFDELRREASARKMPGGHWPRSGGR